jgi:hypothetical protein
VSEPRLVSTGEAARAPGIARRTLPHDAQTTQLTPALVLPSRRYEWDVADVRRQFGALGEPRERGPADDEAP